MRFAKIEFSFAGFAARNKMSLAGQVWREPSIEGYRALLSAGIDLNSVTRLNGVTLLMMAVAPRYTDTVLLEFLLEHGADPNAMDWNGNSALMAATASREIEKLNLLLKREQIQTL